MGSAASYELCFVRNPPQRLQAAPWKSDHLAYGVEVDTVIPVPILIWIAPTDNEAGLTRQKPLRPVDFDLDLGDYLY